MTESAGTSAKTEPIKEDTVPKTTEVSGQAASATIITGSQDEKEKTSKPFDTRPTADKPAVTGSEKVTKLLK